MEKESFMADFFPLRKNMYALAFRLLESQEDAEDVVQDLYLKLWQSELPADALNNPKAWCLTLVRNMCLDRLKSKRVRDRLPLDRIDQEQPPSSDLHGKQRIRAVFDALEQLPENERKVLKMKVLEDLSYEEIEKKTGYSYPSLRVMISNARKKLKKKDEEYEKH